MCKIKIPILILVKVLQQTPFFMKKIFATLLIFAGLAACNDTPTPDTPSPEPTPEPANESFEITVQAERLAAYEVTFDIRPTKKQARYYYDIVSTARLSEIDPKQVKAEIVESAQRVAEMTGASLDEVLEQMLSMGDSLNICSNAGYRPSTEFSIYAFYWDDENVVEGEEIIVCDFTTPAAEVSTESVEITFDSNDGYSFNVNVEPTSGVKEYWYYFAERSKAEAMLRELEDENAFISYHAMNVGTRYTGAQLIEQKALRPETEYMVIVMGIDTSLNRFMVQEVQTTAASTTKPRVESELFTELLGEWQGVQTVTDLYNAPFESRFTVNIVAQVEDYDYDYRANNQLVALVDGWCNIKYYGIAGLIAEGIEEPELKFGPKWLFDIAEGDIVTMDGKVRNSTIGWMFMGDCFMLNMTSDGQTIATDTDFEVEVSDDRRTITIKSPATMAGAYPGMGYIFGTMGWMGYYYGCSNITLTR